MSELRLRALPFARAWGPLHPALLALALPLLLAEPPALAAEDCGPICRDDCCSCGWLVRKTHDDPPVALDPDQGPLHREQDGDPPRAHRGRNSADVAGYCTPRDFQADGWASDSAAHRRSATGTTPRLLRRLVIQHVQTCSACDRTSGRAELDLAVGLGISAAISPDGDCAAWAEGWMSITEARSKIAATAHGGLSLAPHGWIARSRTGSLLGSSGGIGMAGGGEMSGYLDRGPDSTASEAFADSAHGSVERNSLVLRWQAQVVSFGVEAERIGGGPPAEIWGYLFGQDPRTAEIRMAVTLDEARVGLSCDGCTHASSRRQLVYTHGRPDADSGPGR